MAQTKKKRRRKHRGTQGGKIDDRPKGRPRNKAEARARAKSRKSGGAAKSAKGAKSAPQRGLEPPTWSSAVKKGAIAGVIFFALLAFAFGRPPLASAGLAAFMLAFYVPMAYFTDGFFYRRRLGQVEKEKLERSERRNGTQ